MPPKKPTTEPVKKRQTKITELLTVGKHDGDEKSAAPGLKTNQKKKNRQEILEETSKSGGLVEEKNEEGENEEKEEKIVHLEATSLDEDDTKRNLEKEFEEIPLKKKAVIKDEENQFDLEETSSPPSEVEEQVNDKIRASKEPSLNVKHTGKLTFHDEHLTPEQKLLHAFDLTYKFGSCVGVTRLERWERAKRLGLNPPEEIKELLIAENADKDPEIRESLFYGRV